METKWEVDPADEAAVEDKASVIKTCGKVLRVIAARVTGNDLASKASIAKVPVLYRAEFSQHYVEHVRPAALKGPQGQVLSTTEQIVDMFAPVDVARAAAEKFVSELPKLPVAGGGQQQGGAPRRWGFHPYPPIQQGGRAMHNFGHAAMRRGDFGQQQQLGGGPPQWVPS